MKYTQTDDIKKDRLGAAIEYLKHGEVELEKFGIQRRKLLTDDEIREAWKSHGKKIIKDWIKNNPGTRPDAWWDFEAPEPRARISGEGEPDFDPGYDRGLPDYFLNIVWVNEPPVKDPLLYESEAAFLKRHNLFYPGELERISDDAFDPVEVEREYIAGAPVK